MNSLLVRNARAVTIAPILVSIYAQIPVLSKIVVIESAHVTKRVHSGQHFFHVVAEFLICKE